MKKIIMTLLIILFLASFLYAEDYSLVNLDLEVFSAQLFGDLGAISSGAFVDLYFGFSVLFHLGVQYCYDVGYTGFIPEAGIGIVLDETFGKKQYTTMTFIGSGYNEFGQPVDIYWIRKGTCYALDLHMIEAGAFAYLLSDEWAGYETEIWDTIFYAGYRFSSFYEEFGALEEVNIHVYGLLGLVGRYRYERGDEYYDQDRLGFGIMCGLRWYLFVFDLAYYDEEFVLKAGFRIPAVFLTR
ncbi:MAG: hypothetical protein JW881_00740 [Spirochaetales bacterium]|nr:hypothetical protein [Spirochaetales bacterium]